MLKRAKEVLDIEAAAIKNLSRQLDGNFEQAVQLIAKCTGRVVVCGMGKTGIIGRKIAATLSSTGTPSLFLHSAEAVHGDLGQLTRQDVFIVISQSGETEETVRILPLIKRIGVKTIAITGNIKSSLAKHGDVVLNVGVKREGCPLGLAPMASTTATLALGDALAACLIDRKNFKKEDNIVMLSFISLIKDYPQSLKERIALIGAECTDHIKCATQNLSIHDAIKGGCRVTKANAKCAHKSMVSFTS